MRIPTKPPGHSEIESPGFPGWCRPPFRAPLTSDFPVTQSVFGQSLKAGFRRVRRTCRRRARRDRGHGRGDRAWRRRRSQTDDLVLHLPGGDGRSASGTDCGKRKKRTLNGPAATSTWRATATRNGGCNHRGSAGDITWYLLNFRKLFLPEWSPRARRTTDTYAAQLQRLRRALCRVGICKFSAS